MQQSLGRRLDQALLTLQLEQQGSAVDYSREVVSETPTKKKEPPTPDMDPDAAAGLAEQFVVSLERFVDGDPWEPRSLAALKQAVRPLAGRASGVVAYLLGEDVQRVSAARAALNADPDTGLPKDKPLTSREIPS